MTPHAAVLAWWQAMASGDVDALKATVLPDFVSSGGPGGRTVGSESLLAEAAVFFASAQVDDWSITDVEVRDHQDTAVCSYVWAERGSHGGQPFTMRGLATDVLIRRNGTWLHQAHHVSLLA